LGRVILTDSGKNKSGFASGTGTGGSACAKSDSRGSPTGLAAAVTCRFIVDTRIRFFSHVDPGEGIENSKSIQEPQNHGNDYDGVQDLFDRARHWYVVVHQPKKNAYHDQDHYQTN
jgi:hypothetical protein